MKISACYIVKDEIAELEKSLSKIKNIVDEIIVINTGTDNNIGLTVRRSGGRVYPYQWENDFAAARNYALEQAAGDWIVFLDADEYVSLVDRKKMREIIEQHQESDVLLVKLYNIENKDEDNIIDFFWAPRIFKNSRELRYVGKIHEQLKRNGAPIEKVSLVDPKWLRIYHTGYETEKLKAKAERNLDFLLELESKKDEPDHKYVYMYLAETYLSLGNMALAVQYARKDIALGRKIGVTYASRSHRILLQQLEANQASDKAICEAAEKAVKDFPELPEFHAEYAQYLALQFEYEKAIEEMHCALNCWRNYRSIEPSQFDEKAAGAAEVLLKEWQDTICREKSIKISACVIAKDEAKEIGKWIQSMQGCTDEQILVDTGSVDHTAEIAAAAGVKVYHYPWDNDFAKAKNYAIEQATGDWIIFLDADEYFSADTVHKVRTLIAREHPRVKEVDAILCRIVNIDVDKNNKEISRFVNLRMFRNVSYLRYGGNVHESVRRTTDGKLSIYVDKSELLIYHTGYSTNRVKGKFKRNLALLEEDIAQHGKKPYQYRYLMDCYQGLGEYEKAIKYAKMHLAENISSIGSESDIYRNIINCMVFLKKDPEEIRPYIEKAIQLFPNLPDFYAYFAANFLRQGKDIEAKKYLLDSLTVYEQLINESSESTVFNFILSEVYSFLANIFLREGDLVQTKKYIKLSLEDNLYNKAAFHTFYHINEDLGSVEDIVLKINTYYSESQQDLSFIVNCLENEKTSQVYLYYADLLQKKYKINSLKTKTRKFFLQNEVNAAASNAIKEITENISFLIPTLFSLDELNDLEMVRENIPSVFWKCVQRYYGQIEKISVEDFEAYMVLLPFVNRFCSIKNKYRFIEIGCDFSTKQVVKIADCFFEWKEWQIAQKIYEVLLLDKDLVTDDLRKKAGIADYKCGLFRSAYQLLSNINNKSPEIEAYILWSKNKIKGCV